MDEWTGRGEIGPAVRFPAVRGRSLLGADLILPRDFPADLTLAVIAFQRWHQERVDRWIACAVEAGIPATIRGAAGPLRVAVVEVPVLSSRWRPARRFIDGGMTAGIRDPDVLARTITVYTGLAAFRRSLAIPDSGDVHVFVVRRDGAVLARGLGDPDDAGWAVLASVLAAGSISSADGDSTRSARSRPALPEAGRHVEAGESAGDEIERRHDGHQADGGDEQQHGHG